MDLTIDWKTIKLKTNSTTIKRIQDRRERHRLRESIVMFSDRVRSRTHNKPIKESAFNIIFANYSEYKKLGGNGYIEEEMDYIRDEYRTLFNKKSKQRRNGTMKKFFIKSSISFKVWVSNFCRFCLPYC